MAFNVGFSSIGNPFEPDVYISHNDAYEQSTFESVDINGATYNNSYSAEARDSTSNIIQTKFSSSASYTANEGNNGEDYGYTGTQSGSRTSEGGTTYGDTSGSSSMSYRTEAQGYSIGTNTGTDPAETFSMSNSYSESEGSSFTLDAPTAETTTLASTEISYVITINTSETAYAHCVWTSNGTNTAGTEIIETTTHLGKITEFSASLTSHITSTTVTCIRSHGISWGFYVDTRAQGQLAYNDFYNGGQEYILPFTEPNFDSDGSYNISLVGNVGYTSTNIIISSTTRNLAGSGMNESTGANSPDTTFTNVWTISNGLVTQDQTISVHPTQDYTDPLAGLYKLTTSSSSIDGNKGSYNTTDETFQLSIDATGSQLFNAQWGGYVTESTTLENPSNFTISEKLYAEIKTTKEIFLITSFYDSQLTKNSYRFYASATQQVNGLGNYSASVELPTDSLPSITGYASYSYSSKKAYSTTMMVSSNQLFPDSISPCNNIIAQRITDNLYIDFLLQDPYSIGTSSPLAKELVGGFSSMGLIGAGYPNPANFFNTDDDMLANLATNGIGISTYGDGLTLGNIQACLRIPFTANYAGEVYGKTNASSPPIQNKSYSWYKDPFNTSGTTEFITYEFNSNRTTPAYSVTTALSRSSPTAIITSGTTTRLWQTAGSVDTGWGKLPMDFNYPLYNMSNFLIKYTPRDGVVNKATIFNSAGSTEKTISGLINGKLSPAQTLQSGEQLINGRQINLQLTPSVGTLEYYQKAGITRPVYIRPYINSWIGFSNKFAKSRLQGLSDTPLGVYPIVATYEDPSF